jgi:RHS repeat-associated protein
MEHPAEYAAGMSGTLAGLADAAINPVDAVKGLVGTGWGSDPAQALGKLVPNVALAVATDGGGAAADASDVASSMSEDVASQGVSDMTRVGDPVNVATGDVVFAQTDAALPGVLPLVVERVHRSSWRGGRWLGETWASSFDQRLLIAGDRVAAAFADGRVLFWRRDDVGGSGGALPTAGPTWPLRQSSGGTYTVTDPQRGLTWRYERRPGFWEYADGQGELPLVSVTDRTGHTIAFSYSADGQPTSITHSGGYRISVTVDGGRVTGLALDDGTGGGVPLVRYEYDDAGNLTGVVNSSGQPLRFSYDSAGRMIGWIDRNGHSYRYSYDELGRCVRGESPSGALTGTFSYESGVTRWADGASAVTEYRLDRSLRVSAIADPLGSVTRFGHDDRGRVISRTDPLGHETRYGYDDAGNLVSVMRPTGTVARAEYDERSLPVAVTGPDGAVWRQAYDERGNRTSLTAPDGAVTRYGYDDAGHLAEVTGPDGLVTTVACDAVGLLVAGQDPAGRVTRYERDQFGRIGRVIGPDGSITTVGWTVEGRPVSRAFPDGTSETWTWDADGHLIRHVSPSGAVTAYEYGAFDKVSAVSWPDGTRSEFGYDHELRTQSVTHGGLAWQYSYDPAGRLTAETDYDGAVTRYSYDAAGQLVRKVNAAGQETLFGYDPLGSLVEQRAGDSVTTFGYDAVGRLVHARNVDAELSFARDALGRVTAETCDGRTVTTSYDMAGRVTGRVTPSGAAASWEYDDAGRPAAMSVGGQELRFRYGRDGRETHRELPGGVTLTQHWDPRGRLTAQILAGPGAAPSPEGPMLPGHEPAARGHELTAPGQVLQRRGYRYSLDGFVTGTEDLLTGNRTFGLDAAGRVTEVTGPDWTEQYAYDPVGNVASAAWPAFPPEAAGAWLDAGPQGQREVTGTLVSRAGNVRYRHDAAGRVVQRTRTRISRKPETWRYDWDAENRLISVTAPDGSVWRYRYDPLGRRIAKQHLDASGQVLGETRFTWDGTVLAEQSEPCADGSGREQVTTWDYRPGSFAPVAQTSRSSLRDAPQDEIDKRFYAIIIDLTGTPSEMVAPDGTLAGYQQHTLWGGTIWHPSGTSTPLRFPGQYDDPETGLHYNNQRYYDPVTGAYLSPDSLGLAPSPNPHAYVPNPHVLTDPLGLEPGGVGTGSAAGGGQAVQIFRNVDAREFDSIATTEKFSVGPGQMEGKWFATQGAHAEQWGQLLNGGDGITVETRIPSSVAEQLYLHAGKLDGIGPAYYADADQLNLINEPMDGIRVWP